MSRREPAGPRRANSVEAYLRRTRLLAVLALAQYVMFELVRNARMIWTGVLDLAGILPTAVTRQQVVDLGGQIVRDTPRLTTAVRSIVNDDGRRDRTHQEIAFLSQHSDEVLGRWASVMLNAEVYAEVIDRHVELAGDLAWIGRILDALYPPDDARRQKRARSSAAVQIEPGNDSNWLADRIVVITQLAETLDQGTVKLALQIVPVEWWQERLGTNAPMRDEPNLTV